MHGLMIAFCVFCLHCEFNDCIDAATYGVLLLDLLLRVQMIANPSRNSHLIDIHILAIKTSPTVRYKNLRVKAFISRGLWLQYTHPTRQIGSLPLANNALHSPSNYPACKNMSGL